jgi:probable rRNA maturation factor
MIQVAVANEQLDFPVDEALLRRAVERVLRAHDDRNATISIAVVDNAAIHALNEQFLDHDYPTDVLSFLLDEDRTALDGEVIVSAEMAASEAARFGWTPTAELLLYVIHGTLHLVGFDDTTAEAAAEMRRAEAQVLADFGWQVHSERSTRPASDSGGQRECK